MRGDRRVIAGGAPATRPLTAARSGAVFDGRAGSGTSLPDQSMAGDWIALRIDIVHDPAVIAITAAVPDLRDEDHTVGKLARLWSWANSQTNDGHAPSVTEKWIDRYVGVEGFAAAMVSVGWLTIDEAGATLPHFDRWNAQSAKRRILASRRQQRHRSGPSRSGNANVTPAALQKRDHSREENSTGEKSVDGDGEEILSSEGMGPPKNFAARVRRDLL